MQITYFFRKPSPVYHSIEKLFSTIIQNLTKSNVNTHFAKYSSKGLINRILIAWDAKKNQGEINHITGDIHFIALLLKRNRTILTIHDLGSIKTGNCIRRFIIKFFWFDIPVKLVRKVTLISEFTRNELLAKCKVNADKVIVIPNCYNDIYKFEGVMAKNAKPFILQIGTKPNKNLDRLIFALKGIECKLLIVGKLIENQLGLLKENNIDYNSYLNLSQNEMLELYKHCDFLTYISTYEGFGLPVIEANAVGRPVLASNLEPIKTVAGNAALLINPYDIMDIRNGIIKLIEDYDFCQELIENGIKNAEKYHPQKIAKMYMDVYESITLIK
jgi:glycosyltransferase involved in cell wall biosynthesis